MDDRSSSLKPIPVASPLLDGNERTYVLECLDTNWISSGGRFIGLFEQAIAQASHTRFAVATNNGTTALHLVLAAMGITAGDEVIVPTLTYIASANAVRYCNATPVFVDCEPACFNLDPGLIEDAITPRTRAIMPVHLYGHPVDMDPVLEIARRRGLKVVVDAAEALGALYRGKPVGALGDAATYSFFGNKVITTGEGGMIVTDDEALDRRMRFLRGQGMDPNRRYWHTDIAFNYRMTNVAAAIGLGQAERLDHHLAQRRRIAATYDRLLAPHGDLVVRPVEQNWARHAYWMYTIQLGAGVRRSRDDVMKAMAAQGVETRPVFYPVHQMPPYRDDRGRFPVADRVAAGGMNLPTFGTLSDDDIARVVASLLAAVRG